MKKINIYTSYLGFSSRTENLSPQWNTFGNFFTIVFSKNDVLMLESNELVNKIIESEPFKEIFEQQVGSSNTFIPNDGNLCCEIHVSSYVVLTISVSRKKIEVFSDPLGLDTVYYCKIGDSITYSNRLDWLITFYNRPVQINYLSILDAIYFDTIIPPKTFFNNFSRLEANKSLTICEQNLEINTVNWANHAMINRIETSWLDLMNHINRTAFQRTINSKFIDTFQWFDYLPITAFHTLSPCISYEDNLYSLLLAKGRHEEVLTIASMTYLSKLFSKIAIEKHTLDIFDGISSLKLRLLNYIKLYPFPENYLIEQKEKLINHLTTICSKFYLKNIPMGLLYDFFVLLPDKLRKLNETAIKINKHFNITYIIELIFSIIFLLAEHENNASLFLNSLILEKQTFLMGNFHENDPTHLNIFDALQRIYYSKNSEINKIFNFHPTIVKKIIKTYNNNIKKENVINFIITLLTADYLQRVIS